MLMIFNDSRVQYAKSSTLPWRRIQARSTSGHVVEPPGSTGAVGCKTRRAHHRWRAEAPLRRHRAGNLGVKKRWRGQARMAEKATKKMSDADGHPNIKDGWRVNAPYPHPTRLSPAVPVILRSQALPISCQCIADKLPITHRFAHASRDRPPPEGLPRPTF